MAVAQYTIWFVCIDILHLIAYNISKGGAFMGQATFSVRMDENLKNDFDSLCADFGMSMTTAINVFARAVVRERRIPFEIAASSVGRPRLSGMEAFSALRAQAKEDGIQDMSLDEINEEIRRARYGEGS